MNLLLVLPILMPLLMAATSLLCWRRRQLQRWCGVIGMAALCVVALVLLGCVRQDGIQAVQIGDWPAPFGITLVADLLSAIMVVLAALIGLAVAVYSLADIEAPREAFGYYPLLHILLMGICGAFLTGDLFNLYVWFEVMLIASFGLLALGGEQAQIEGAIKYVTLNLLASAVFLAAVGILYGISGTLNMADLARKLAHVDQPDVVTTESMLFLIAFGIKAAVFPLFFWLPASYHTPPAAVAAIFAGLLTKVGVYALIRVFTLLFVQDVGYTHSLILLMAGLTMITGILGAIAQRGFRRVLSFQVVSHIGYMIMGLGLFTSMALAGSVFYIMHHIIVITGLFLVSGLTHRLRGTYDLKTLGGLYAAHPMVALLFLIPALSLAGVPPLSGFVAKLILVRAGLESQQYLIVATALGVGLLTLYSMSVIWTEAFWKNSPHTSSSSQDGRDVSAAETPQGMGALLAPTSGMAFLTVALGIGAEGLLTLAMRVADQLLEPTAYIQAVLGDVP
jgi:multicomponent Na+:H+ antiporter subunit D